MIIGVDARPLVEKKTGFGYFLENTLLAMLAAENDNRYVLISDRDIVFKSRTSRVSYYRYIDKFPFKTFYYYSRLAGQLMRDGVQLDAYWGTEHFLINHLPAPQLLTVHDFTPRYFPKATTFFNRIVTSLLFKPSLRLANTIVCISNATRTDLLRLYGKEVSDKKVEVIYHGGNTGNPVTEFPNISNSVKKLLNDRYILFVGTVEPRKNVELLVDAAPKLVGVAKIVVCGKFGWESKEFKEKLNNTENLVYLDYVSQSDKVALMNHCICFTLPSWYEGFGMPVVEAMQAGAVTLVANNSSLSELVTMEELLFITGDTEDFVEKAKQLVMDESLLARAHDYCRRRGKYFSWDTAAKEYLAAFDQMVNLK